MRGITEDEKALLNHISRWGSDGYPITKFKKGGWCWGPFLSVQGPPVVFKTKHEAVESFETFHGVLLNALGEVAQARALAEEKERNT